MSGRSTPSELADRVRATADAILAEQGHVSQTDLLCGLGWTSMNVVDRWRQGRVPFLENVLQVKRSKLDAALAEFRRWAEEQGLEPEEVEYAMRSVERPPLRFTESGDPETERRYRTHWLSPTLPDRQRDKLHAEVAAPAELVAIMPLRDWTCSGCGGTGDMLVMEPPGPRCLPCAGLGELVYLPAGDAGLTRRARKASELSAVVVRYSRARRRYERQGLLVEPAALAGPDALRQA